MQDRRNKLSINSLTNFGVPGQGGQRSPQIQPVLLNRFRVTFFNFGNPGDNEPYDLTRAIRSVQRPTINFADTQIYTYHSITSILTRMEAFEPITISFHEDIDNQVLSRVYQQCGKQQNHFDQTASRAGENYKFEFDVDILAGGATAGQAANDPNVVSKFCFVGCFITNANLADLTYENADKSNMDIQVRYDNFTALDSSGNVLGQYDHSSEIDSENGSFSTGVGGSGVTPSLFSS